MSNFNPTDVYFGEHRVDQTEGISIRAYIAIECLRSLLIHDKAADLPSVVKTSVEIADMLIEELKKDGNVSGRF